MYILINYDGSFCTVLDTKDFVVDKVSVNDCRRFIKNGVVIDGVELTPKGIRFSPRRGVLPDKFKDCSAERKASLLSLQQRGLNLMSRSAYTRI